MHAVRPSQPFDLSISGCGLTCIQLNWLHPDEVRQSTPLSRFEVKYTVEDKEGGGAVEPVDSSTHAFNFTDLIPGKAYQFSVTAVSVAGAVVARSRPSNPIGFPGKNNVEFRLHHYPDQHYYSCFVVKVLT